MNAHEKEINEMLTKIDVGKLDTPQEQPVEIFADFEKEWKKYSNERSGKPGPTYHDIAMWFYELGRNTKEQIVCEDDEKYFSILEGFLNTCWGEYFLLHEREDFQNWIENRLKPACKEHPVCEGLEEELVKYIGYPEENLDGKWKKKEVEEIARHFYELGRQSKPDVSNGLYDFMKKRSESLYFHDDFEIAAYKKGVVDGAKWQKEDMMKEAVLGTIKHFNGFATLQSTVVPGKYKPVEEVKLIIVKE